MYGYIITGKRYAAGKYIFYARGSEEYKRIAERTFLKSIEIYPVFNKEKFVHNMKNEGVPFPVIEDYLKNFYINDDTFSIDSWRRY
ncbi:MAG: hypothetical protein PHF84_12965 [bacterium]|nr:hypothetical protein [bacterium]